MCKRESVDDVRLEDRARIEDLTTSYAYAVDGGDWAAFEALYVPDATIDYRAAGGIMGTPAEVAAWMAQAMTVFSWSMHSMSTHRIAFTSADAARGSVHVFARHGVTWEGVEQLMDVSAVYHDEYVCTSGGWRFASRIEQTYTITGGPFAEMILASLD
jgi:SnoaL-like domain